MTHANTLSPSNVTPESVTDTGERHRRWLRRGCWGGCLFVVFSLLAVVGYPSLIRWRLESRGWEIEYAYHNFTEPPPRWLLRFMEPWFSEYASARFRQGSMTADDVRLLARLPRVWALDVHETVIPDATVDAISQLKDLELLEIVTSRIGNDGIERLSGLLRLKELRFKGMALNATQMKGISSCSALRELVLEDVEFDDDDIAALAKLRQLDRLVMSPSDVGDVGLEHVADMSGLRSLILGSTSITDAGIKHLRRLPKLRDLFLGKCQVTDQGVKEIAISFRNLTSLWLHCPSVTDAVLTDLADLPSLETLELSATPISTGQFHELKRFPALNLLMLGHDKVGAIDSSDWSELKRVKPNLETSFVAF